MTARQLRSLIDAILEYQTRPMRQLQEYVARMADFNEPRRTIESAMASWL